MNVVVTGSIAFDYLMTFPGYFKDHILPDQIAKLSVSFLVDSMRKQRGGVAPNIAYSLALLGEHAIVMGTAGQDFGEYRAWLDKHGVDTAAIVEIPVAYHPRTVAEGKKIRYTDGLRALRTILRVRLS